MLSKYKNWTDNQLSFLLENYGKLTVEKISKEIEKSIGSIYYILKKENIDLEKDWWSKEEIKRLREMYSNHSNQELEKIFTRSEDAIQLKAASMSLRKDTWWSEKEESLLREMVLERLSYAKMAKILGRSKSAVYNKLIAEKLTDECRKWSKDELTEIKELATSGENTYLDIAMKMDATPGQIYIACKHYGWKNKIKKTISYGNDKMVLLLKKMFKRYTIKQEYHIGEKLRLDAYVKELNLGFEYDGIQHFRFTPQWHRTKSEFIKSQERDRRKEELCREQGITLVRVKYNEDLTEELLWSKINIKDNQEKDESIKKKAKIQNKGFQKRTEKYKWPTRKIQNRSLRQN